MALPEILAQRGAVVTTGSAVAAHSGLWVRIAGVPPHPPPSPPPALLPRCLFAHPPHSLAFAPPPPP